VNTASRAMTLSSVGTLKVELKIDDQKADVNTYLLAGSETTKDRYLGELVFTTENEPVKVKTLVLGRADGANCTDSDVLAVRLYDKDGVMVAQEGVSANGHANFDSLNYTFPADQATSFFIGVVAKTINAENDPEGTATFGHTIKYTLATSTQRTELGLSTTAVTAEGVDSGSAITMAEDVNATIADNEYSSWKDATSTEAAITGSVLNSVVNSLTDGVLTGGTNKTIGKYKFVFNNGTNRTSINEELKAKLVELKLSVATSSAEVTNVQAYIEGQSSIQTTAVAIDFATKIATINLTQLTGDTPLVDGEITLVIIGDVGSPGTNAYVQTSIATLSTDFTYNGNAGTGSNFTGPRLDVIEVIGGTLSN